MFLAFARLIEPLTYWRDVVFLWERVRYRRVTLLMSAAQLDRRAFLRASFGLLAGSRFPLGGQAAAGLSGWPPSMARQLTAAMRSGRASLPEVHAELQSYVRAFKATLPGRDSGAFRDPSEDEQQAFIGALSRALTADPDGAAADLDPLGYDVLWVIDSSRNGSRHLALRERQPYERCWGLFLVNESPVVAGLGPIIVEAPHPVFDTNSAELAIEAYRELAADAFLMAGAHRYANGPDSEISDMARNPHSILQRVHERLATASHHVLNYHGFAPTNHPGYPNVVLSNGSDAPHTELFTLKEQLEARAESAGVYDGVSFGELSGTVNPQGRHTRALGGRFYHMEHVTAIRTDPERRTRCVEAMVATLRP